MGGTLSARGGPIELTARESIVMSGGPDHPSRIFNSTDSTGNRGDVTLSAPVIRLENKATIETTAMDGSAGSITIQGSEGKGSAATNVLLDNAVVSTTTNGGSAASPPANITVTADTATLSNGARITADTQGATPAGDITFNVGKLTAKGGPHRIDLRPNVITDPHQGTPGQTSR
jgi:hypothetical protein